MALRTPPSWLQNGSHPAENDRLTQQSIFSSTGIIGASSMQVTAQASPNMTVNVASGWASILSSTSNGGVYVAYNDAAVTLTVTSNATGSTRIDRVVATVNDSYYSGASNNVVFSVVVGTTSAPATPSNSISLATISVANGASAITSGNITDTRTLTTSSLVSQSTFLPVAGGTMTGTEILAAGTTSVAPLKFQSGVALSAAAGASVEYDGTNAYLTPSSAATSGRGALGAGHYYEVVGTTPTIANTGATYLSLLGVGLTVAASTTYEVELNLAVSGLGSTSRVATFNLIGNGTATLQSTAPGGYLLLTNSSAAMAANNSTFNNTPAIDLQIASGSTATVYNIHLRGLIRVNASGTINPAIKFSVATGTAGITVAGSYARFTPITGTSSFQTGSNLALGAWA